MNLVFLSLQLDADSSPSPHQHDSNGLSWPPYDLDGSPGLSQEDSEPKRKSPVSCALQPYLYSSQEKLKRLPSL
ncbi:MAG: hypothetical protein CL917_19105 [Deltaproteobacteria bacterium]|nr:hypothetical protein [Deltaproteobacteria bacterium]